VPRGQDTAASAQCGASNASVGSPLVLLLPEARQLWALLTMLTYMWGGTSIAAAEMTAGAAAATCVKATAPDGDCCARDADAVAV